MVETGTNGTAVLTWPFVIERRFFYGRSDKKAGPEGIWAGNRIPFPKQISQS